MAMPSNLDDPVVISFVGEMTLFFQEILPTWGLFEIDRFTEHAFRMEVRPLRSPSADPIVLRVCVGNEFASITNILVPGGFKHQGLGKMIIARLYDIAKRHGRRLELHDMVQSFYTRMIARGAVPRPNDSVEITDATDLNPRRHTQ